MGDTKAVLESPFLKDVSRTTLSLLKAQHIPLPFLNDGFPQVLNRNELWLSWILFRVVLLQK